MATADRQLLSPCNIGEESARTPRLLDHIENYVNDSRREHCQGSEAITLVVYLTIATNIEASSAGKVSLFHSFVTINFR